MENKKTLTNQEYQFIYERAVRLCLDFIIVKNGKVLLAKRDIEPAKGQWCLPGGMVYRKESINEAAERILISELGLKLTSKRLLGYMEFPDEVNQNGFLVHSVSMGFLVILEDGEIEGGEQAHEISFFSSIPEDTHPTQAKFLKDNWDVIMVK